MARSKKRLLDERKSSGGERKGQKRVKREVRCRPLAKERHMEREQKEKARVTRRIGTIGTATRTRTGMAKHSGAKAVGKEPKGMESVSHVERKGILQESVKLRIVISVEVRGILQESAQARGKAKARARMERA